MAPYEAINLSQHWFRQWVVAWGYHIIAWTNVGVLRKVFSGVRLWAIWQDGHVNLVRNMCSNYTFENNTILSRGQWVWIINWRAPEIGMGIITQWLCYHIGLNWTKKIPIVEKWICEITHFQGKTVNMDWWAFDMIIHWVITSGCNWVSSTIYSWKLAYTL